MPAVFIIPVYFSRCFGARHAMTTITKRFSLGKATHADQLVISPYLNIDRPLILVQCKSHEAHREKGVVSIYINFSLSENFLCYLIRFPEHANTTFRKRV